MKRGQGALRNRAGPWVRCIWAVTYDSGMWKIDEDIVIWPLSVYVQLLRMIWYKPLSIISTW